MLEVPVDSLESAKSAMDGGAKRIELVSHLSGGGVTPSPGLYQSIRTWCGSGLRVLGDFVYSEDEIQTMIDDIKYFKINAADGIVLGALTDQGEIDVDNLKRLMDAARPDIRQFTFHRAFDMLDDPQKGIETLLKLGFTRILTSGFKENAFLGKEAIKSIIEKYGSKIVIMPGAGVNSANIKQIMDYTGAKEIHASGRKAIDRKTFVPSSGLLVFSQDDALYCTDKDEIKKMIDLIELK